MEFQTNKGTATHSSNGKCNYAAKLGSQYIHRSFFFPEDLMRFLKTGGVSVRRVRARNTFM